MELQSSDDLRYRPFHDLMENSRSVTLDMASSYGILNNSLVNRAVSRVSKVCEPIVERCTNAIDSRVDSTFRTFVPIKNRVIDTGREILYKTKARLLLWNFCDKTNLYNTFVSQWLVVHMPFTSSSIVSFDDFSKRFDLLRRGNRHPQLDESLKNFYSAAQVVWLTMKQPNIDEIKQGVLEIVARTVNKNLSRSDEAFGNAIYQVFCKLINNKNELVSEQTYINMVKIKYQQITSSEEFQQALSRSALEYYDFAKRFILLDFPLARIENSIFHAWYIFIRDRAHRLSNSVQRAVQKAHSVRKSIGSRSCFMASRFLRHCETQMELLHQHLQVAEEAKQPLPYENQGLRPEDEAGVVVLQFKPRIESILDRVNAISGLLARNAFDYATSTRFARILGAATEKLSLRENIVTGKIVLQLASERVLNSVVCPALSTIRGAFQVSGKFAVLRVQNVKAALQKDEFKNALRNRYSYLKHSLISIRNMTMEIKIERDVFEKNFRKIAEDLRDLLNFIRRFQNGFGLSETGRRLYESAISNMRNAAKAVKSSVEAFKSEVHERKLLVLGKRAQEEEESHHAGKEDDLQNNLRVTFREQHQDFLDVDKMLEEVRRAKLEPPREQPQLHNESHEMLEESLLNETTEKILDQTRDHHEISKIDELSRIEENRLEESKLEDESKIEHEQLIKYPEPEPVDEKEEQEQVVDEQLVQEQNLPLHEEKEEDFVNQEEKEPELNAPDSDAHEEKPVDEEGYHADSNEGGNNKEEEYIEDS